ncbi:Putative uncharacterized protein [Mycobacterium tuberculosis variant bovis]|nr:Putative uncharacterized protein [Mycobacterium tuberculosis variant bovis]CEJ35253.1 Putative uncharacterized protein [Mycobacterium tuberculosis variant bovis]CEJ39817.1 Putative uncharacterized protein [Mycobacterium tuberculosis variant bovis]CEJ52705.1 Putative uncharacterized protein [Mycobacterium tuberculosis variant caprae]
MAPGNQQVYGGRWHRWNTPAVARNFHNVGDVSGEAMGAQGYLRRLTRRLTEDLEQRDVEELSDEVLNAGAQRAIDCQRGQEVTVVGTLRSVETNGKGCSGGVSAELFDGSDTVTLVWLGQRRIPGIDTGRTLRVRGRLGKLENGTKAIYNPHYEIQR